jgi:hypothetical protein
MVHPANETGAGYHRIQMKGDSGKRRIENLLSGIQDPEFRIQNVSLFWILTPEF